MNLTLQEIREIALMRKSNKNYTNPNINVRVKYNGDDFIRRSNKEAKELIKTIKSKYY